MAVTTKIPWAESTPNFWLGCTRVSDACRDCYAEPFAEKMGVGWGDDAPRHRTGEGNWSLPVRLNAMHDLGRTHMKIDGKPTPVPKWMFANSLSDFFDKQAPAEWRTEAWRVIRVTPLLCWIILTKRIPNVVGMLPDDWNGGRDYRQVGIVASVCNQQEFNRDVPRLVALKSHGVRWVGLSIEPQLAPISMDIIDEARQLDWVIGGGESQHKWPARKYQLEWAERLIEQCRAFDIPYFQKQLGDSAFQAERRFWTKARAGTDADEWPAHLRVQEMPRVYDHDKRRPSQPTLF
jgi:protein gp37